MLAMPFDILLHLDKYINLAVRDYGLWIYLILFLIIFIETGVVFAPFLPGDSLIFVAGALVATGALNPVWLFVVMASAAILGDTANYWIGHHAGRRIFSRNLRFIKKEHLDKTEKFYEKHGGKTIIIARFLPIIRTFAPFVAGVGKMEYRRFLVYNVSGALIWVSSFLAAGYYFGNIPIVKDNLGVILLLIIAASLFAAVVGIIYPHLKGKKTEKQ